MAAITTTIMMARNRMRSRPIWPVCIWIERAQDAGHDAVDDPGIDQHDIPLPIRVR
jgi:hypothetical protein